MSRSYANCFTALVRRCPVEAHKQRLNDFANAVGADETRLEGGYVKFVFRRGQITQSLHESLIVISCFRGSPELYAIELKRQLDPRLQ